MSNPLLKDKIFGLGPSARKLTAIALLGLLVVTCGALVATAISLQDRVASVRAADSDNLGWSIAHLRVDHLDAQIALEDAIQSAENGVIAQDALDAARQEFDIFYSRIDVSYNKLARVDAPDDLTSQFDSLLVWRETLADRYDAISGNAVVEWQPVLTALRDIKQVVRDVSIGTIVLSVNVEQTRRRDERQLMLQFLVKTMLLGTITAVSAYLAFLLWRDLENRTGQVERAASMVTKAYEASLNAVIVSNMNGQIILCNAAAESMFGLPTEDMYGRLIEDIMVPPKLRQSHRRRLKRLADGTMKPMVGSKPFRTFATRANGEEFPVEFLINVDNDLGGKPILISFVSDISEQVEAENNMRAALEEARRHAAAKSTFLASMSHEMRTPLHGLIASLELIDMDRLDEANQGLVQTALDCSQRTLTQVNDVLEITRQGESKEARDFFSPSETAQSIIHDVEGLAEQRGNQLTLTIKGDADAQKFYGYPGSFARALTNLAANACKFTHNGRVAVSLNYVDIGQGSVRLEVSVEDTGPGISTEDQRRIFQFFETVKPGEISADSGNGLGLPIVKIAVDRMGGKLSLTSELDQGSKFTFSLTLEQASDVDTQKRKAETEFPLGPAPTPRNILIVDDNEVNLALISEMLRRQGHQISTASNGLQAVNLAAAARFDIIMMDVSMPVMDGREATRLIRREGKSVDSYIMGITALVDAVVPEEFINDGMDSILGKPVSQRQLANALLQIEDVMSEEGTVDLETEVAPVDQTPEPNGSFDYDQLCGMVGEDMAQQLITETVSDVQKAINALVDLSDDSANIIHHAVGPTGFVGWTALSSCLKATEVSLRQNNETEAKDNLAKLQSHLEEISVVVASIQQHPRETTQRPQIMDHPAH